LEYIARKISRAKWVKEVFSDDPQDISADALTGCLRTSGDTLSFWQCDPHHEDVTEVVHALATPRVDPSLPRERGKIERIDVVLLRNNDLEIEGFTSIARPGNTCVNDLCDRHIDLTNLTMNKLCSLAKQIVPKVRQSSHCHRFTRGEIIRIIDQAVKSQRLNAHDLDEKIQIELRKLVHE
jgi:hypothetical protein